MRDFKSRIALVLLFICLGLRGEARADDVDKLIRDLTSHAQYKVRLSAALALAKRGDQRAIPAFVKALDDSNRSVRGVAAGALGKLVDGTTPRKLLARAKKALTRAAKKDSNKLVRNQAKKALAAIAKVGGGGGGGSVSSIYVDIGQMSAKAGDAAKMKALMRGATAKLFKKHAPTMSTQWPGSKPPSARDLKAQGATGFHVDGTLVQLSVTPTGSGTDVSCKLSMLIATYPQKSMFGFLQGGARVSTGKSKRDIAFAEEDCVAAVVENLVVQKIIPAIKGRAPAGAKPRSRKKSSAASRSSTPRARKRSSSPSARSRSSSGRSRARASR